MKTGSESIEATKRRILIVGFVARMEDTEVRDVLRVGGSAGCVGCFQDDLRALSGIYPSYSPVVSLSV